MAIRWNRLEKKEFSDDILLRLSEGEITYDRITREVSDLGRKSRPVRDVAVLLLMELGLLKQHLSTDEYEEARRDHLSKWFKSPAGKRIGADPGMRGLFASEVELTADELGQWNITQAQNKGVKV